MCKNAAYIIEDEAAFLVCLAGDNRLEKVRQLLNEGMTPKTYRDKHVDKH
jgi:hypothetical protein